MLEFVPDNSGIDSFVAGAWATHGEAIRNDSKRKSPRHAQIARACMRKFVDDMCRTRQDSRGEVSKNRKNEILEALASGLGMVTINGRTNYRHDAAFFSDDLIDRNSNIVRQPTRIRALSENIPVQTFDMGKEAVRIRGLRETGSMTHLVPGQTQVNHSGHDVGSKLQLAHMFGTKTQTPWEYVMYSANSDISAVEEDAKSAMRVLADGRERLLVNGFAGTDLISLQNVQIPKVIIPTNWGLAATTIEDVYEQFMTAVIDIDRLNEDRGGLGSTAFVGSDFIRVLLPKNNIAAGGSITGSDLFAALGRNNVATAELFRQLGIDRIIKTPSLNRFGGDANKSAMLIGQIPAEEGSLQQLVGMLPAPVRTVQALAHDETLFAMKVAGLQSATDNGWGLIVATVGPTA